MKSRLVLTAAFLAAAASSATRAHGYQIHYTGPAEALWSNPANWSSGTTPVANQGLPFDGSQSAVVAVANPTTLTFDADHATTSSLVTLDLSATSASQLTFLHPQGALTARSTTLDSSPDSSVSYLNLGGHHTATAPSGSLTLSASAGSTTAYTLDHAARLSTGNLIVGRSGDASFHHLSGTVNVATNLTLAADASASARYTLSTGHLVAGAQTIGQGGTALLRQTGGQNWVDDAITVGPRGTYQLAGGAAQIRFGPLTISSGGTFAQSAGSLTAPAVHSDGAYTQSSGTATIDSLTSSTPLLLSGTASLATRFAHLHSLSLAGHASFDITTGSLIVDHADPTLLRQYIVSGLLTSAVIPADPAGLRTVGYAPFGPNAATLLRATLLGDADLDGLISDADYAALNAGFSAGAGAWSDGDFNHDGLIDQTDYLLIDQSHIHQLGTLPADLIAARAEQFGASYASQLLTAVPEPSAAVAVLLAAGVLVTRRRSA